LPESTHAELLPNCTELIPHVGKLLRKAMYADPKSMLEIFDLQKAQNVVASA